MPHRFSPVRSPVRRVTDPRTGPSGPPPDTVRSLGMMGGQMSSTDFAQEAALLDLAKRARCPSYVAQFGNFGYGVLRVSSMVRASNVTTVTLVNAPGDNPGDFVMVSGMSLKLTCIPDATFNADGVAITVTDQTHFTYPNTGSNGTANIVSVFDVPSAIEGHVPLGANGHPAADHRLILSTIFPGTSATANTDLNTTYTVTFPGAVPTSVSFQGCTSIGYSDGAATFQISISGTQSQLTAMVMNGVATNGTYQNPTIIPSGEDQSGVTVLKPAFKTSTQRYKRRRWMDWLASNGNPTQKSWAKRPLTQLGTGVPFETIFAASNEIGADCWLNIPPMADDDYVTGLATLAKNTLNIALDAIFEPPNEPWNSANGFTQWHWILAQSKKAVAGIYHNFGDYNEISSLTRTGGVATLTLTHPLPPECANGVHLHAAMTDANFSAEDVAMTVTGANSLTYPCAAGTGAANSLNGAIFCNTSSNLLSGGQRSPYTIKARFNARRCYDHSQLIKAANGGVLNARAKMVLTWQFAPNGFGIFGVMTEDVFPWLEATYGPVSAWLYAVGAAPYARGSGANAAAVCAAIQSEIDNQAVTLHAIRYVAAKYGLKVWMYEGGPDLIGLNASLTDSVYASSAFRTATAYVWNKVLAWGADLFMTFTDGLRWPGIAGASSWGAGDGIASLLPVGSASSEKQKGTDDVLLAAPPAIADPSQLPGTVEFINVTTDAFDGRSGGAQTNGVQCLQGNANNYVEKAFWSPGGAVALTFWGKYYINFDTPNNNLRVYVDGVSIGTIALFTNGSDVTAPSQQGGYASPTTLTPTLTRGWHVLKCQAPAGGQPDRIGVSKVVGV